MVKRGIGRQRLAIVSLAAALAWPGLSAQADTVLKIVHVETNPAEIAFWQSIGHDYEAGHKGVSVQFQYLENEAYKAKLPTMLQSQDRPAIIYSWAGGVMRAQIAAGFVRPLGAAAAGIGATMTPTSEAAYTDDGHVYGVPVLTSDVVFFYNKALFAKAGVDAASIKTWDDFLAAVKKIKAAGITPIVVGAGEKWPMHFYWSYLAMRAGGPDVVANARAGKDGGFDNPAFIEAGTRLRELSDLEPFQPGYLGSLALQAAGLFGDGKGAMQLMGNWLIDTERGNAADGKGLSPDQMGVFSFPELAGGKGHVGDVLGGVNGFLVTKDAPPEAEDFLAFFSQPKYQIQAAANGYYIPTVKGAATAVKNPAERPVVDALDHASGLQLFFDQDLGPSVGRVVNDVSVAVAAGKMSPKEAAAAVQQAWDDQ